MGLFTTVPEERPEAGDEDRRYHERVMTPSGPEHTGTVLSIDHSSGIGYVSEDGAVRSSAFSRKSVDPTIFDTLNVGGRVRYRVNVENLIVTIARE